MAKLIPAYPPRGSTEDSHTALLAAWWDVLSGKPWLTIAVFEEAVRETLETVREYLPTPAQFLDICKLIGEERDREKARATLAALPAPERRAADPIDPRDPYSCTPEERQRWAEQDAWIRGWQSRLVRQTMTEADQLATDWPNLRPVDRRAKERRLEVDRERAVASIRATFAAAAVARIAKGPTP